MKIRCAAPRAAHFLWRGKPSPLGGRWRGTRRMRGKCPEGCPSSVTCGDSFPHRGKPQRHPIKPSPLGGRWRGTRRMRGKYPESSPSSVTFGDSFPRRGKPYFCLRPSGANSTLFIIFYLLSFIYKQKMPPTLRLGANLCRDGTAIQNYLYSSTSLLR